MIAIVASMLALSVTSPGAASRARCKPFRPSAVPETSGDGTPALDAPVARVTDKATEEDPLVIEYEHELSYGVPLVRALDDDEKFFNFQVVSKRAAPGLHLRAEWDPVPHSDIDLYLHDRRGKQVAYSDAWNVPVLDDVSDQVYYEGHGGLGYEYIEGYGVANCGGYTLMSETALSPGTSVTLTVWLGPETDHYSP